MRRTDAQSAATPTNPTPGRTRSAILTAKIGHGQLRFAAIAVSFDLVYDARRQLECAYGEEAVSCEV